MAKAVQLKDKNGNKCYVVPYFPIGSIYLTFGNYDPSTYFGGKWKKLTGGYLYATSTGVGQTDYTGWGTQAAGSGNTGSTTLTIDQIPSHNHYIYAMTGSTQWAIGYLWSRAAGPTDGNSEGGQSSSVNTRSTGGGKGHTHTLSDHTHKIASVNVFVWKRIA